MDCLIENGNSTMETVKSKRHFPMMKGKKITYGNHITKMDDGIIIRSMIKTR